MSSHQILCNNIKICHLSSSKSQIKKPWSKHHHFAHHFSLNSSSSDNNSNHHEPILPTKGYWDALAINQSNPISRIPPSSYKRYQASDLSKVSLPPRCAVMLVRDFIQDSLYNPNYGYFSKKAVIFSPKEDIKFNQFKNIQHFMNYLGDLYKDIEDVTSKVDDSLRQVWHTPTELFRPWYGYSIAKYIIKTHLSSLNLSSSSTLNICEIGAGNGTLMLNILEYIKINHPDIFSRTRYNVIEISTKLAALQHDAIKKTLSTHQQEANQVYDKVRIINKSIFEWDDIVLDDDCFIIAMEVIDNFAHDLVRYDYVTGSPMQGLVMVDENGDFQEVYEPASDPLLLQYLTHHPSSSVLPHPMYRAIRRFFPFAPNLSPPEFLPTKTITLFNTLHKYFPKHKLILSDFDQLPDIIPNHKNGPVVQIRYQGQMIACSTYLVQPGWFDIFFPIDFEELKRVYLQTSKDVAQEKKHSRQLADKNTVDNVDESITNHRPVRICNQKQFLLENGQLDKTITMSGENPMLSFYENFKFMLT